MEAVRQIKRKSVFTVIPPCAFTLSLLPDGTRLILRA
jgi:hypothetical protein